MGFTHGQNVRKIGDFHDPNEKTYGTEHMVVYTFPSIMKYLKTIRKWEQL